MHERFRKVYIRFSLLAALSWSALVLVVLYTQPEGKGNVSLLAFYVSLLAACVCTVTLIEVFLRKRFVTAPFDVLMRSSVRQAVLVGLLVVSLFALQAQDLLFWWVAGSLVLLFICIEALCNL